MKKNGNIFPIIALTVICLVITVALGFTNHVTKDKIAENTKKEKAEICKVVLSAAHSFTEETVENTNSAYKGVDKDGNVVGYVFETVADGYGGEVIVMTGIDLSGKTTGVKILSCEETPGLGKKAEDDSFLNQYKDKIGAVSVVKGEAKDNEIEAISGATISSKAVTQAVNKAITAYETVKGE